MPFSFTDEQQALVATVRQVLADRCTTAFVRAATSDPQLWRDLWAQLSALDIPALTVPERDGGLGLDTVEVVAIAEAAGRAAAPVPLTTTIAMFVPLVARAAGDDEAGHEILRSVASDGSTGTACIPPANGPIGLFDGGRLTLRKTLVGEAGRADWVAVPVRGANGSSGVLVAPAAELEIEILKTMDRTRPLGRIELDDRPVDRAVILQGDSTGGIYVALTGLAAELVGLASELLDRSVSHATDRIQFGTRIGAFQAVKHQLVDAHLAVERARSLTYRAAVELSGALHGSPLGEPARRAAHVAKAAASEAATAAARTAVQVHGGMGITQEHDVSLLYLRARQTASWLGGPESHYAAVAVNR